MKPMLCVLCVTLLLAPLALGQEKKPARAGGDRPGGGRMVEALQNATAELNLTAEQQAKVDAIAAELPAKMRELVEQTQDMEPRDRAMRVREMLAEARSEIEAVLDDQQKAAFAEKIEAAQAQRQARRAERNADQQQQQPGNARRPGAGGSEGGPGAQMIDRIEKGLAGLNLTDDQKAQAEVIVGELRTKLNDIRANADGDIEAARAQAREAFGEARRQIGQMLDDEQRRQLRESMAPGDGADRPNRRRGQPEAAPAPPATGPSSKATNTPPAAVAAGGSVLAGALARVGEPVPHIPLIDLNGKPAALKSQIKTRPLIVVNGSYSSPIFRDRAPALRDLRRSLGSRADVCVVYVAEAHPAGEWDVERNRDDGVSVPHHETIEARSAAAEKARKQLDLDLPMLVDEMSDGYLRSVDNRPNAAVILARDGTIVLFQNWFDPHAVRRALEALKS